MLDPSSVLQSPILADSLESLLSRFEAGSVTAFSAFHVTGGTTAPSHWKLSARSQGIPSYANVVIAHDLTYLKRP